MWMAPYNDLQNLIILNSILLISSKEKPSLVKPLLVNMIIEIIVKDINLMKKWLHFIQIMNHLVLKRSIVFKLKKKK